MLDTKTMIMIGAAVLAVGIVVFILMKKKKGSTKEGFLGNLPTFKGLISPVVTGPTGAMTSLPLNQTQVTSALSALQSNTNAVPKGNFFSNPAFQSILAPRAASVNYGANIRHNMPATQNQGIPCNPLTFGKMATMPGQGCNANKESYRQRGGAPQKTVKEGYSCGGGCGSGCTPASCNTDGTAYAYHGGAPLMPADYTAGNYSEVLNDVMKGGEYIDTSSMLPVTTMTTIDDMGEMQPVQFSQQITTTTLKSRGQAQGDMVRGDLVPCATQAPKPGWFTPSQLYDPVANIQQGALNIITDGLDSNLLNMAQLVGQTTSLNTMAGAPIDTGLSNLNMVTSKATSLGMHQSDINVTGFP
jgi:hypothetical protein